jgi:two-component system sensor histidine kinase AlgZ
MMADWAGLWHREPPRPWRAQLPAYVAIYLLVPLGLALMFAAGRDSFIAAVLDAYPTALVISTSVGLCFELQYHYLWPLLITRKPSWPVRIAGHLAAIAIAVLLGGVIGGWLIDHLWGITDVRELVWRQSAVIATAVIAILVTTDELSARGRAHERQATEARVAVLRAELSALQARTDPHFLFNSLNTIAALIPDDPTLAETVLERLAVVFRYALDAGRRESVPLVEELAAVEAYLEVEALRLGDRLAWRIDREGALDAVSVLPLALQPLAENGIRHGAGSRLGATELVVMARCDARILVLAVEDRPRGPQRGAASRSAGGAGVALDDLRKRLALAYGERATFEAGPREDAWRAEITIEL